MTECVQYIIVRKDLVPAMGVGKTAAQCCHASLAPLLVQLPDGTIELSKILSVQEWLEDKFTKIVVYVKSKQKLLNLAEKLDNLNIRYKPIHDRCLTCLQPEEEDGTTLTCIGVIPLRRNEVPECLKKLQLLDIVADPEITDE